VRLPGPTHHVLGFQHLADADRFLEEFRERLRKFGLELRPDKTRRIEFGRFAKHNRNERGEGKPETFDFLGFTHLSGKDRNGSYAMKRKTISKLMRAKVLESSNSCASACMNRWRGLAYGSGRSCKAISTTTRYRETLTVCWHSAIGVIRLWRTMLIHRGQKHHLTWERMRKLADRWKPQPRVLHPYPRVRFDVKHPR
jgi:RNA-directed DNA polymerase